MNVIVKAAAVVTAIGTIGGGAIGLDMRHASQQSFSEHIASDSVKVILQLVEQAAHDGPALWLCRAIDEEFIALCTSLPDHYLCRDDDAKIELKEKAGCD